jgi:hypothetical protein
VPAGERVDEQIQLVDEAVCNQPVERLQLLGDRVRAVLK